MFLRLQKIVVVFLTLTRHQGLDSSNQFKKLVNSRNTDCRRLQTDKTGAGCIKLFQGTTLKYFYEFDPLAVVCLF